jgi:hypothetical protein
MLNNNLSVDQVEKLMHMKAKVTSLVDYGMTASGIRFDVGFEGELSGETITGKMQGIDYFLRVRTGSDRLMRGVIYTDDGAKLLCYRRVMAGPEIKVQMCALKPAMKSTGGSAMPLL